MKILKPTLLAAAVALAFTVTSLTPAPYLGADAAHAAAKKSGKKAKAARKGPGRCGTYMYWHKGKCNDARLGARKK